jgi:hypothetical protein
VSKSNTLSLAISITYSLSVLKFGLPLPLTAAFRKDRQGHVVNRRQPCQDQRAVIDYTQRLQDRHDIAPFCRIFRSFPVF